ncbi:hypothetical protein H012_gp375 [Acanthamoeba polyphaga moumouvirus]|uniref:Uncharacterized protein n=2 Tax=Moumouvirus TaxID=3080801 RepID=L7RCS3_9VIRU|nr:hypothetical protein H012_gp375 [Acanthamoeba polyphaga moumouvirus]AEX62613.1 hypothetical protein mv_L408 [Moumouvirus Monve]AGC02082.1 hypothetical protein Moumou_00552 [Acanthamoeba polyphaga moumouvirus]AQN68453.1 hypothetical protein [Saudi moumouvirus]
MSKYGTINFTYGGPYNDIIGSASYYDDGTVNIKYTLLSLKNLLLHNVNIIDKLLENNNIKNIMVNDTDISVEVDSNESYEQLVKDEVLINETDNFSDYSGEIETNQDRLNRVLNMTNINETENIFGNEIKSDDIFNSDSENSDSESNDLLNDDKAHKYLFNAFELLINSEKDIHSDSD